MTAAKKASGSPHRKRRAASKSSSRQTKTVRWTVKQGGMTVASGSGPAASASAEGMHYARVYAQSGPVLLTFRNGR